MDGVRCCGLLQRPPCRFFPHSGGDCLQKSSSTPKLAKLWSGSGMVVKGWYGRHQPRFSVQWSTVRSCAHTLPHRICIRTFASQHAFGAAAIGSLVSFPKQEPREMIQLSGKRRTWSTSCMGTCCLEFRRELTRVVVGYASLFAHPLP